MKIYIASDHGGYQLKGELKDHLTSLGYAVEDIGAFRLNPLDDYTDFVFPLAEKVGQSGTSLGVVVGRSGNGEAIAANKVKGVRAAVCLNEAMAQKSREHNNANILALGSDFIDLETAKKIVNAFLETTYPALERHQRRLDKIAEYESRQV
ncbi:hypothetical protein A2Z22_04875 [Candidatus Woesebacteria bacterium RBG_16_34_12]|uniref:Ribose-5-phosphate isomerase n=1 Tax=Candidatus Woesebacteria bacterium RBG_16_34_12 TaxID=1802480 RepID=A0A1F7XAD4_9BACT|nr:MAG: hypothetical protein A2Z22_04875 [Candidatus Woesebacteria bacterium RBG_16_34_12]